MDAFRRIGNHSFTKPRLTQLSTFLKFSELNVSSERASHIMQGSHRDWKMKIKSSPGKIMEHEKLAKRSP